MIDAVTSEDYAMDETYFAVKMSSFSNVWNQNINNYDVKRNVINYEKCNKRQVQELNN